MEKKKLKFNIVDVVALILIVAVIIFAGFKLTHKKVPNGVEETIKVTYWYEVEGVAEELYENCVNHIPSPLMASGALVGGSIVDVEKKPFYVLSGDGHFVEDPTHVTLRFQVETSTKKGDVLLTKVGEQEVRIGKEHILKSEFIEFNGGKIVDVQWGE